MASQEAAAKLQEELSCSICFECFKDPVSIHCGHNFCRECITSYWGIRKKKSFSCPRCRETGRKKILNPNLELKNIAEIAPKLQVAKEAGEVTCKKHQEPLKLFCKDDQTLICVVCDRSKEHRNHVVLPLEEAAQDYKGGRTLHFESASGIKQGAPHGTGSLLKIPHSCSQEMVAPDSQASGDGGRRPGSFRQRMRQCRLGLFPASATTSPQLPPPVQPALPGPAYYQQFAVTATTTSEAFSATRAASQLPGRGDMSSRIAHPQSDVKKQIQDQLKPLRQKKDQLLAFKAISATKNKESLAKIKSEVQKAESVFEQAHELLHEQKQFLLAQWESLRIEAEKQHQEYTSKLLEEMSCLDSLIIEAERGCRRPATEFLQDVKSTLVRFKKRKFPDSIETASGLEESLNSLIRKNAVVEEMLWKIRDTLPSEADKDALSLGMATEEASSPAMKRKMARHDVIVPVRNTNAQGDQTVAACSMSSSDGRLGSRMSFPAPSVPDEAAPWGDARTTNWHKKKSSPQCPLS
ncbi:uncharacterized protein LOC143831585 isoform X2 [Paroedura picta]|uniref:uncharacterized protein LOC143831585 isoform X2 n=1 Tax=Paroedura picta TaxID=143630 RepID=UPI004055A657